MIDDKEGMEILTVKSPLWRVHPLEIFLQVLATEITRQGNHLLDPWVLRIFRANIFITRVEDVLIHQSCPGRHLSEEADLHWLPNLHSLSFLHEDLPRVLAAILSIQRGNTVLFRVMAFSERLESSHQIMPSGDTGSDDTFSDTGSNCTLDNGSDRVHGTDYLGLVLWWHVESNLLEQIFGSTETANDKDVLGRRQSARRLGRLLMPMRWVKEERQRPTCSNLF